MTWIWCVAAFLAGALVSVQTGINTQLGRQLGQPLQAAFVSFVIGTLALGLALPLLRVAYPAPARVGAVGLPLLTGGVLGAIFVFSMIALGTRLSAAVLVGLVVGGQLIASLVLDHFGWLGFPQHALSVPRIVGAGLIVAGVLLIRKF
ncbi:MAG: DMT family transporter [Planctomycetes bacterium]|nr:DMT family transporter [Planctomycetota bacterium]MCC7171620.1 DMT family transporter [Planctomycetota bacterium]